MEYWESSDIVKMHQKHLKEIVEKTNQLIDNFKIMNDFINSLVKKVNEMDDEIMELARKVHDNG
jgi:hypothetical protein